MESTLKKLIRTAKEQSDELYEQLAFIDSYERAAKGTDDLGALNAAFDRAEQEVFVVACDLA